MTDLTLEEYLSVQSPLAIAIYESVAGALDECGDYRVDPQETRIAFVSRVTFGAVSLARKWADLSFLAPAAIDTQRVRKLELRGPTSWEHTIRLYEPKDVDGDVQAWLCEAWLWGNQESPEREAETRPLPGHLLAVFWTGWQVKVDSISGDPVARVPDHVAAALELVDEIEAKVGGIEYQTRLLRRDGVTYVPVDLTTGLGRGDDTDVYLGLEM